MEQFTNTYQLEKTLKFKLEPQGKTADTFKGWLDEMAREGKDCNEKNLLAKDRHIRDAYLAIKPIMDKLHEQFIEKSLTSDEAKQIDFSDYLTRYRDPEKGFPDGFEKKLRGEIGKTYNVGGRFFSEKIEEAIRKLEEENNKGKKNKKKTKDEKTNNTKEKPFECLTDKKIINYLSANVKALAKENNITKHDLEDHLKQFKQFWGYLDGYNQSRKNYYVFDKEASTAVATRIVHENLPTFCSNALRFEKHREDYLGIYQFLKDNNRETKIKNAKGEEVEAEAIKETYFLIEHFNECLAQSQIEEYNRIIGNYNYLINLYNQLRRGDYKEIDEFETLKKQIGCGKKNTMFAALIKDKQRELTEKEKRNEIEDGAILTVETLLNRAKDAGDVMFNKGNNEVEIKTIPDFIQFLKECDNWDGIYMSKTAINKISNLYFANWHSIVDTFVEIYNGKDKELKEKVKACITYDKNREEPLKLRDAVELSGLFAVLDTVQSEHFFKESLFKDDDTNEYRGVLDKALLPSKNLIKLLCFDMERNIKAFLKESDNIVKLEKYKEENKQAGEEDETITEIKKWFDVATDTMRIVRYFAVRKGKMKGNLSNVTMEQALSSLLFSEDVQWFKWYDLIRNYLTKKPQDDVKENELKLNFGKGNLLNGWTDSQTKSDNGTQYGGYLFRKLNEINEYDYYLGISKDPHLFREETKLCSNVKSEYERLDYYQIKGKTFYGNAYQGNYEQECRDIINAIDGFIEKDGSQKSKKITKPKNVTAIGYLNHIKEQDEELYNNLLHNEVFTNANKVIIQSLKSTLSSLGRIKKAKELSVKNYDIFSDLLNDIKLLDGEKVFAYFAVSQKELDQVMYRDDKTLYLFKIINKDLSFAETFADNKRKAESRGKDNLHTMYFKALMEGDQNVFDIGKGEIFYREKAFDYDKNVWNYGHHYKELKNKFNYPIISKKRFAQDSFQLHLSIIQNYSPVIKPGPQGYQQKHNKEINAIIYDTLQQSDNLQFIGIDRGEKHLVYSCTIDKDGKIVKDINNEWKCRNYDIINGTDYVQKLEAIAGERIIAKKNWQAQSKIKDLRNGYISHVVHRLVEEVIKEDNKRIAPHAYIVLEDLSTEMKRGRQKFEKQVYQNLEVALAKKLNFVVDKEAKQGELGSVSKALQLTPQISNYQDIEGKKQFGIMLYTRANYTSITDPATGWRKTIYIRNGKEEDIKKQILDKFSDFGVEGKDYFFEYTEDNVGHTWRMYSGKNGKPLPRFRNKKEPMKDNYIWVPEQINVVELLDKLFADFDKTKSFKEQIEDGSAELKKIDGRNETAWQSLRYVIDLIQQIRNSGKEKKDDNFLLSPVRDKDGKHFDTRNHENNGELSAIKDADANGAYNIARKGLIMNAHYRYWADHGKPEIKKGETALSQYVSDKEWDMWLLDKEKWHEHLGEFALRIK